MRRLVFLATLFVSMAVFPRVAGEGSWVAQTVTAEKTSPASASAHPVVAIQGGLYTYKGVDTRHGPQCVEYAERFYTTLYPGTFPYHNSGPGAYDIWEGVADQKEVGGWSTHRQYFVAYENGSTAPRPDDMLLYDRTRGGGWGHIAIIAEVDSQAVVILEQNSGWDTKRVLPRIGNQVIDHGVKGVIRLKANDKQS